MDGERHLHFNIITALWFVIFYVVLMNGVKYGVNRWKVPGLTELVNNVTGG